MSQMDPVWRDEYCRCVAPGVDECTTGFIHSGAMQARVFGANTHVPEAVRDRLSLGLC
jgi:hypothetical protein